MTLKQSAGAVMVILLIVFSPALAQFVANLIPLWIVPVLLFLVVGALVAFAAWALGEALK